MKTALLCSLMIFISFAFVQEASGQSQFQVTIGGDTSDFFSSMVQTSDGGCAIVGTTYSFGNGGDIYVVRIDASGNVLWNKAIGGAGHETGSAIIQSSDGGFIAAGKSNSAGSGGNDAYIIKLDASGNILWGTLCGGTDNEDAWSIVQSSDGSLIAAGWTQSFGGYYDIFIIKLDENGSYLWSKTIGVPTTGELATSIVNTSDGGFAIGAYTGSFGAGGIDLLVMKLDADCNPQWSTTIGGTANDYCKSVIQTADGGYAATGYCMSFGAGGSDMYVVKLNSSGGLQWTKTIGGTGYEIGWSIIQTTDGGYAIGGQTNSFGAGSQDLYIVKLNSSGTIQWNRAIGGTQYDIAMSVSHTSDGGYLLGGYAVSFGAGFEDIYIVKLNNKGNTCSNSVSFKSKSSNAGTAASASYIAMVQSAAITNLIPTISSGGNFSMMCNRNNVILGQDNNILTPEKFGLEQNYPNPFNPKTTLRFTIPSKVKSEKSNVRLVIYDLLGREVETLVNENQQPGVYEVEWDASDHPSGLYFYSLSVDGRTIDTKRMVLIK